MLEHNNPIIPDYIEVFYAPIRDNIVVDVLLMAVCLLIALDLIFGMAAAAKNGEFESSKGAPQRACNGLGVPWQALETDAKDNQKIDKARKPLASSDAGGFLHLASSVHTNSHKRGKSGKIGDNLGESAGTSKTQKRR